MKKYEFSVPMPYTKEQIDKLVQINNEVEKSKITSLYFSLPSTCELFTRFEQYRTQNISSDFNYWKDIISYSLEKNFDFIYLLNRPNSSFDNEEQLKLQLEKLDKLLNKLKNIGVNKLRISDHKLLSYLNKEYSDFTLYSSTSFEYKTIGEYKSFMHFHPYVKQIVPSHDLNKNFRLLENLTKSLTNTEIELMVNQGCWQSCPFRTSHNSYADNNINRNNIFSNNYYIKNCSSKNIKTIILRLVKNNTVFPWEIEEYFKIGITKFKFTGRDEYPNGTNVLLASYEKYLKGIDNYKNIEDYPINLLIEKLQNVPQLALLKVKDIKKYLPDIKYFIKNGHKCASICGNECRYCYNGAEKIQKVIFSNKIINTQICYIEDKT